jgi:hypothetical protein
MLHRLGLCLTLTIMIGAAGCVERRLVIVPTAAGSPLVPLSAIVYDEKDQPIGAGPVDKPFTYYGKYRFRLAKDGYETLVFEQRVRAPWYELPGLDFISENLIPWTIRDVRYIYPVMQRAPIRPPEQTYEEAERLRAYGKNIGDPGQNYELPTSPAPTTLLPPVR